MAISLPLSSIGQQDVILSKEYDERSANNVPWLIFSPFAENTIQWTSDFGLYTANVGKDGMFTILASKAANIGKCYTFQNNRFGEMQDGVSEKITIINRVDKTLFFGLTQDVVINDECCTKKPISIACVPYNQTAEFSPLEKITIFLGSGYQEKKFMGTQVHSEMFSLDLTAVSEAHLVYDEKAATFIKCQNSQ